MKNVQDIKIACKIACLGGAVVDHVRRGEDSFVRQAGGVALNMAHHFRELGYDVGFFGAIGRDEGGEFLKRHLASRGITSHLLTKDLPTAEIFHAYDVEGTGGQIRFETAITDQMDASDLLRWDLSPYDVWVVDTDFPSPLIEALASQKPPGTRLFGTVVSKEKAPHLPLNLTPFEGIFMNVAELKALSPQEETLEERIAPLRDRGCRRLFVTQGAGGAWMATPDELIFQNAIFLRTTSTPTTTHGAGDAFAAHSIHALLEDGDTPLLQGLQGAHHHLKRINAC